MSNALNPIQPHPSAETAASGVPASAATRHAGTNAAPATPAGEAVTLSADAQASTQLLNAARAAPGIDQVAVVKLQAAIQTGTYNVPPESLAVTIQNATRDQP